MAETIETRDLVLAYEVWGPRDGRPAVLVHGWPDDVHCWDGVVPALVEAGWQVYAPHLRGFGATRFRRPETMRSGQIGALGRDLCDLIEGLDLHDVALAGHDWGARASYVASVLLPERVRGLVAMSVGYGSTSLEAPISFEQAHAYWYQWFFATPKGRRTLERDRRALCRHLWRAWAPSWRFTQEEFDETAGAWDNPDWPAVTVHSYTHRWGGAAGDPAHDGLEAKLAENPPVPVPTIVLHGAQDGATLAAASEGRDRFFTAGYERLVLDGIGHFVPREAPERAAEAILRVPAGR
jgi:pimeloyl-ACP methyl ester carboxylesterase